MKTIRQYINEARYIDPKNLDNYDKDEIEEITTSSGEKRYKRKLKDIQISEPTQHSVDKVTLSKSGEPMIGTHKVDYEYDDDDNLIAVDTTEKDLSNSLAIAISDVRRANTIIKRLKSDIKEQKELLMQPYVDHYKAQEELDKLEQTLANVLSKQKLAKKTMYSKKAQLDKYYKK